MATETLDDIKHQLMSMGSVKDAYDVRDQMLALIGIVRKLQRQQESFEERVTEAVNSHDPRKPL